MGEGKDEFKYIPFKDLVRSLKDGKILVVVEEYQGSDECATNVVRDLTYFNISDLIRTLELKIKDAEYSSKQFITAKADLEKVINIVKDNKWGD